MDPITTAEFVVSGESELSDNTPRSKRIGRQSGTNPDAIRPVARKSRGKLMSSACDSGPGVDRRNRGVNEVYPHFVVNGIADGQPAGSQCGRGRVSSRRQKYRSISDGEVNGG